MLSREQRRSMLVAAEAARGDACFAVADELDRQGIPMGTYDLGENRIRFAHPIDELAAMDWTAERRSSSSTINPLLPPPPLTIFDHHTEGVPDEAYRTRWW